MARLRLLMLSLVKDAAAIVFVRRRVVVAPGLNLLGLDRYECVSGLLSRPDLAGTHDLSNILIVIASCGLELSFDLCVSGDGLGLHDIKDLISRLYFCRVYRVLRLLSSVVQ